MQRFSDEEPDRGTAMITSDLLLDHITGIQKNRLTSKELNPVPQKPQQILIFSRYDGLIYAVAMFV
jgi:hypothetical protein